MSFPSPSHTNSCHYRTQLCRILKISSADVIDLTDHIDCGHFISAGGSGQIFKGKWKGVSATCFQVLPNVVVKVINIPPLKNENQKIKRYKKIKRELELWSRMDHCNILPLIGIACIGGDSNVPAFISPWMEYGNVVDFVNENPTFPALNFLRDIIEALHYLHTFEPEIVHGDIKGANVLVNHRKEACLCDFGLSRFAVDNTLWRTTASQAGGTLRWMAPELFEEESVPTKASDIYAYGMTCYEILSGNVPFQSARNDAAVMFKVLGGQRPERTISCHLEEIWIIITLCWAQDAKSRPSTADILASMRRVVRSGIDCDPLASPLVMLNEDKSSNRILPSLSGIASATVRSGIDRDLLAPPLVTFNEGKSSNRILPPLSSIASATVHPEWMENSISKLSHLQYLSPSIHVRPGQRQPAPFTNRGNGAALINTSRTEQESAFLNTMFGEKMNLPLAAKENRATKVKGNVKRRNAGGKYVCPFPGCGRAFARTLNLKTHLSIHDKETLVPPPDYSPYNCDVSKPVYTVEHIQQASTPDQLW